MSIGTLVASRTGIFFGWWVVFVSAALIFLAAPLILTLRRFSAPRTV